MDNPAPKDSQPPTAHAAAPPIPTAGPSRAFDDARLTLARILAGAPPPEQVLAAAAALAVLDDSGQPPVAFADDVEPLAWHDGREQALAHLRSAIDEAPTMAELARIATAALELRSGTAPNGDTE